VWDESQTKAVDVIFDAVDSKNRLAVDVRGIISGGTVYTVPPFTYAATFLSNQTNVTLVTPPTGKKIQVIGVLMTSDDSLFTAKVEFLTSVRVIQEHFESGTLGSYIPCNITGATNEVVTLNIAGSTSKNWFIQVNYAVVD
jgi:hypothetical protein